MRAGNSIPTILKDFFIWNKIETVVRNDKICWFAKSLVYTWFFLSSYIDPPFFPNYRYTRARQVCNQNCIQNKRYIKEERTGLIRWSDVYSHGYISTFPSSPKNSLFSILFLFLIVMLVLFLECIRADLPGIAGGRIGIKLFSSYRSPHSKQNVTYSNFPPARLFC